MLKAMHRHVLVSQMCVDTRLLVCEHEHEHDS